MPIQRWDIEMSVGEETMDEQHRSLINILNDAFDASRAHEETKVFELIDRMIEYTEKHFQDEEALLESSAYPALEEHRSQHLEFTRKVLELNRQKYEHVNLMSIFKLLNEWLTRHIIEVDKRYEEFIRPPAGQDQ